MSELTVEACMRTWQPVLVPIISMNIESAETIHTLKLLESVQWNFAGARDELKKFGTFFLIERPNSSPEPLNLWRGSGIVVILRVIFPVIHIYIR
jgi:hypothetical protein